MKNRVNEFWPDYKKVQLHKGRHFIPMSHGKKCYRCCFEFGEAYEVDKMELKIKRCSFNSPYLDEFAAHVCDFNISVPDKYELPSSIFVHQKPFDITNKAIPVTCGLNISINAMCSDTMNEFINSIYQEGFRYGKKCGSTITQPRNIIIKDDKLRYGIVSKKDDYLNKSLQSVKECLYFSCTFDAGTTNSRHALFWCAASPGELTRHLLLGTETMQKPWCAPDYKAWAEKISNNYQNLVAFVGDGLMAAINGIADFKKDGLCKITFGTVIIFSPCHNHIVNNAFKKTIKASKHIEFIVAQSKNLAVLLNKSSVKNQKIVVPHIPETRWLYSFDVVKWIMKNKIAINSILSSENEKIRRSLKTEQFKEFKNGIPDIFEDFLKAALPIKKLQLDIERDSTSIALVYPLFMRTISEFNALIESSGKETIISMARQLKKSLINEFKKKARIPLLILSFSLTPLGLRYIKKTPVEKLFDLEESTITEDRITSEMISADADIPEAVIPLDDDSCDDCEKNDTETQQNDIETNNRDTIEMFRTLHATINTKVHLIDDIEYEGKEDLIYSPEQIMDISSKVLVKRKLLLHARTHSCSTDEEKLKLCETINGIRALLNEFYHNTVIFKNRYGDITMNSPGTYGYSFWRTLMSDENKSIKWIAKQALQFIAIAAGESDCERVISMSRALSDSRRGKEKDDLTIARLIIGITEAEKRKEMDAKLRKREYPL